MVSAISTHALSNNALLSAAFGPGLVPEVTNIRQAQSNELEKTQHNEHEHEAGTTGGDTVEISDAARAMLAGLESGGLSNKTEQQGQGIAAKQSEGQQSTQNNVADSTQIGSQELTDEEKQQVQKLKRRDTEVRTHEQAHAASAGGHARGGPKLEFETGPDGKQYAVSGEVSIDTSPVSGNPQATITKMQQVRRAALAPAQPSGQDRAVAAQALAAEREARSELAEQRQTEQGGVVGNQALPTQSTHGSSTLAGKPSISENPTAVVDASLENKDNNKTPFGQMVGLILDIAG